MARNSVVSASIASGAARTKSPPPPLSIEFASDAQEPSERRQSTTSYYSTAAGGDSDEEEPPLSSLDSSAALILVHDSEDSNSGFGFSDDEGEEDEELVSPMFELRNTAVFPPLPPSLVFLYLLAPYLRLGALNLPYTKLPLKLGLPALLLSALASAFARQIWYMLARYLRKANMTDIILDTFARGRGKERQRVFLRAATRTCMGVLSVLMCIIYLRYSMYNLLPLMLKDGHPVLSYTLSTLFVNAVLCYFSYARAIDYRCVIYATWLSVACYVAWLGLVIYAHTQGILKPDASWLGSSSIWPGLVTVTFTFCSSSTLPLYSSLKSSVQPHSSGKVSPARSFRLLSFASALLAVLLLLPSTIFSAFPNRPASASYPLQDPLALNGTSSAILEPSTLNTTHVPILGTMHTLPPELAIVRVQIHTVIRVLASASLLLSIPSVMATTPQIAIPSLRSVKFNVPRVLTILIMLICSVIPPKIVGDTEPRNRNITTPFLDSSRFFGVIALVVLFMAYAGTYFMPTFLHVSQHFFKRPLAIVVPPRTPLLRAESGSGDDVDNEGSPIAGPSSRRQGSNSSPRMHDELLLRKERALQKRQLKRRIVWDVGVWLLLGSSIAGVVGYSGNIAGFW